MGKVNYINNNPVEAGLVFRQEYYRDSSAVDYSGDIGLIINILFFFSFMVNIQEGYLTTRYNLMIAE